MTEKRHTFIVGSENDAQQVDKALWGVCVEMTKSPRRSSNMLWFRHLNLSQRSRKAQAIEVRAMRLAVFHANLGIEARPKRIDVHRRHRGAYTPMP